MGFNQLVLPMWLGGSMEGCGWAMGGRGPDFWLVVGRVEWHGGVEIGCG